MGMGGSKSKEPEKGKDGLAKPTVTSVTPTAGNPIARNSVAVQDKMAEPQKASTLLSQNDEDELLKKGMG